ncbi:CLUMA_CG019810, isoform A [Clunio marinus]|uniref:CLUMA_CG019810, isoform A n=1 Tax=Clunio marinus TaxID=568069 RepID=A0A1J1J241_9DIPT|nr:CLUMA_CG019810, isoform A [Clunio marinus]
MKLELFDHSHPEKLMVMRKINFVHKFLININKKNSSEAAQSEFKLIECFLPRHSSSKTNVQGKIKQKID